MPEVTVRKRLGRRSGDLKYRLNRWFYRNRPKVAVTAAFVAACLAGLIAAAIGVAGLNVGGHPAEPVAAAQP
ncbi:hypothetical protein [Phenylobacterium soli]|uniref:Uncharacterized protein n=1 Tax=Phenylobacterium soli TaxID=2170551 RepID=A0A328AM44_9CAUL|nr:hypothetical protein [Phenylobacterium soli]RAK55940.1 hypothetical protein DJ017_16200 [Phenylobacterium soli]